MTDEWTPLAVNFWRDPKVAGTTKDAKLLALGGFTYCQGQGTDGFIPTGALAIWRPILRWTLADVIAIHRRHGITPNPLYLREAGANRVGCWPCIMCGKAELKLLSRDDNRVRALEALEFCVGWLAAERYAVRGHIIMRPPAFFRGNRADRIDTWCGKCRGTGILDGAACETCKGKGSRLEIPTIPIRARLEWAWTSRGGSQMRMDLPEDSGCMRWGMCDTAGDPD